MLKSCCYHCYKFIEIHDVTAANMWIEIVQCFRQVRTLVKLREENVPWAVPCFALLERLRFIKSCDYNDGVLVQVIGHQKFTVAGKQYENFCLDPKRHRGEFNEA